MIKRTFYQPPCQQFFYYQRPANPYRAPHTLTKNRGWFRNSGYRRDNIAVSVPAWSRRNCDPDFFASTGIPPGRPAKVLSRGGRKAARRAGAGILLPGTFVEKSHSHWKLSLAGPRHYVVDRVERKKTSKTSVGTPPEAKIKKKISRNHPATPDKRRKGKK